jgi:hypothetical protein
MLTSPVAIEEALQMVRLKNKPKVKADEPLSPHSCCIVSVRNAITGVETGEYPKSMMAL